MKQHELRVLDIAYEEVASDGAPVVLMLGFRDIHAMMASHRAADAGYRVIVPICGLWTTRFRSQKRALGSASRVGHDLST